MVLNRRSFLVLCGGATGAIALGFRQNSLAQAPAGDGPFVLPDLPYAYNALEPYISAETMTFHHDKHHAGYVRNLNRAIANEPSLQEKSIEEILNDMDAVPEAIRTAVRNNGGGHANHAMFWESMSPDGGGEPSGAIAIAIENDFGSFEAFLEAFDTAGKKQFGSGWAWLVMTPSKTLKVMGTSNQDSPLMQGMLPILGNDVWEHAYYLTYRNRRGDYLKDWWNLVDWQVVEARYRKALTSFDSIGVPVPSL